MRRLTGTILGLGAGLGAGAGVLATPWVIAGASPSSAPALAFGIILIGYIGAALGFFHPDWWRE